jgi:hypothetical protein
MKNLPYNGYMESLDLQVELQHCKRVFEEYDNRLISIMGRDESDRDEFMFRLNQLIDAAKGAKKFIEDEERYINAE